MSDSSSHVEAPTTEVVRSAFQDVKELLQAEMALAKNELQQAGVRARRSAILFAMAIAAASAGLSLWLVAAALAIGGGALTFAIVGALLLAGGWILVARALRAWPKSLLGETERRVEQDIDRLRENLV